MSDYGQTGLDGQRASGDEIGAVMPPFPQLECAKYRAEMSAFELTEDQERELLETLWALARSFAKMGFSVDICGLLLGEFNEVSLPDSEQARLTSPTIADFQPDREEVPEQS